MSEERLPDWRNINVRRNRKYEAVVDRLCSRRSEYTSKPIFEFNKDLMVFAAVLGFSKGRREELEPDSIQITLQTYASDEKDGFIYLLSLVETKDVSCLKDENLSSAVKIFEQYCNGGLALICDWLEDNPGDIEGVDTLISHLSDELADQREKTVTSPKEVDVEF